MELVGEQSSEWWLQLQCDALAQLAEGRSQRTLAVLCERLGWDLGVMWLRESERLTAHSIWTTHDVDASEFVAQTGAARLARGEGAPGSAWLMRRPCCRTRFDVPSAFLRAEPALRAGMRSGIWVPLDGVGDVIGVLELLRRDDAEATPDLLDSLGAIGNVLAIYLRGVRLQDQMIARERAIRADLERQVADRTRELEASQARLERFYSSDIIGMFVGTIDGVTVEANHAFLRIIGYTDEDVVAGAIRMERVSPEWSERDAHALTQLHDTGVASAYEKEFVRKDGSRVPVVLGAARLGDTDLVICFVLDNTRRKQVERDLASLNDRLEERFLERTAELRASQEETAESERRLRALAQRLMMLREETGTEVAREIHDVLGSELTGLKMDISWVVRRIAAPPPPGIELTERLSEMIHSVDRLVSSVQKIATDLRPPVLDDLGLAAALCWWGKQFAQRSGLEIVIDAPDHVVAPPDVSTALFRIAQELLTNVVRHARARRVEISLSSIENTIELRVEDDGVGIDPSAGRTSLGLTGIRERVLAFSGSFEIVRRSAGGGSLAVVRIAGHGDVPR